MAEAPVQLGVTYAEIRTWAVWLNTFTASDLADAMGVDYSWGERGIKALLWNEICVGTGDFIDGPEGEEEIISYVPLPPGPREHWTDVPPEKAVGYTEILSPRGMPVRLQDNTDRRNQMQGTGGARIRIKQRDKAYEAMQDAARAKAAKAKEKERIKHEGPKVRRDASLPV